jgi:hypothetical protein
MQVALTMRIDFYGSADRLTGLMKAALFGFVLNGYFVTFIAVLCITIEVMTAPGGTTWAQWLTLAAALFVAGHAVLESRSSKALSRSRWILFLLCIAELVESALTTFHDPNEKVIFSCVVLSGGLSLLGARVLLVLADRLCEPSLFVRFLIFLLGWHTLIAAVVLLLVF